MESLRNKEDNQSETLYQDRLPPAPMHQLIPALLPSQSENFAIINILKDNSIRHKAPETTCSQQQNPPTQVQVTLIQ